MYNSYSVQNVMPAELERSREAAARYAILIALRESRRSRRESTARSLVWTPMLQRHRRWSARAAEPASQSASPIQPPSMKVVRMPDPRAAQH
jgi:hypothetical protein